MEKTAARIIIQSNLFFKSNWNESKIRRLSFQALYHATEKILGGLTWLSSIELSFVHF